MNKFLETTSNRRNKCLMHWCIVDDTTYGIADTFNPGNLMACDSQLNWYPCRSADTASVTHYEAVAEAMKELVANQVNQTNK